MEPAQLGFVCLPPDQKVPIHTSASPLRNGKSFHKSGQAESDSVSLPVMGLPLRGPSLPGQIGAEPAGPGLAGKQCALLHVRSPSWPVHLLPPLPRAWPVSQGWGEWVWRVA